MGQTREEKLAYNREYSRRPEVRANPAFRARRMAQSAKYVGKPWAPGEARRAVDAFDEMVRMYGESACWACGIVGYVDADHNHKTGMFRGWLCRTCNFSEGWLKIPARARMLADFMEANQF
jgi:hypothetical protein